VTSQSSTTVDSTRETSTDVSKSSFKTEIDSTTGIFGSSTVSTDFWSETTQFSSVSTEGSSSTRYETSINFFETVY